MIGVVFAAIASALLVAIETIDEREKPDSYRWVAGWAVSVLFPWFAIVRWGARPWGSSAPERPDPESLEDV